MACHLYNTGRCLQLQLFNRPNFGVHFKPVPVFPFMARSFLNISTLSGFIFPAFKALRFAFNQFKWSCSSIRYFDGFL